MKLQKHSISTCIVTIIFTAMLCLIFRQSGEKKGYTEGYTEGRYEGILHRMKIENKIITRIRTHKKIVALTLDACGNGYDSELISFLSLGKIPATIFLTKIWIDENKSAFGSLKEHKLFNLQNHGRDHKPPFLDGRIVAGIKATAGRHNMAREILWYEVGGEKYFGGLPRFYRSATGTYCKEAIDFIYRLGRIPIGGDVISGDWDPKATKEQLIKNVLSKVRPGSIIWMHMNRPDGNSAEASKPSQLPYLNARGCCEDLRHRCHPPLKGLPLHHRHKRGHAVDVCGANRLRHHLNSLQRDYLRHQGQPQHRTAAS